MTREWQSFLPIRTICSTLSPVRGSNKLVPRPRGPYQVMSHAGAVKTIQDLVNDKVVVAHIQNLRRFNYDADRTDPIAVAQQNTQESEFGM